MIKFFRKIRQKLLSENKFSKYLIYAVGEIILVVIGILIALQINNWNESRKNAKLQYAALSSLKQNLIKDSLEIHDELQDFKDLNQELETLKKLFKGINVDNLSYETITSAIVSTVSLVPAKSTFDELQSSGRFNIISNRDLTDSIIGYYNFIEDRVTPFTSSVKTYARSNFAPHLLGNYQLEMDYVEDLFPNRPLSEVELEKIKGDLFMKNAVNQRSYIFKSLELTYQYLMVKIRMLIAMIENELK